jgi:hypothetical protein
METYLVFYFKGGQFNFTAHKLLSIFTHKEAISEVVSLRKQGYMALAAYSDLSNIAAFGGIKSFGDFETAEKAIEYYEMLKKETIAIDWFLQGKMPTV